MTEEAEGEIPASTVFAHTLWTKNRRDHFLWTTGILNSRPPQGRSPFDTAPLRPLCPSFSGFPEIPAGARREGSRAFPFTPEWGKPEGKGISRRAIAVHDGSLEG
ncbi:hypothetical protein GCM10010507_06640 [Streptomyces cinnamoneus]|uniref:Uncharacterized protein n=1 Tax=Streptomyces cinnamoneus TaxID=53446 RepID=A0A918TBV9_STRCJ|nr:hypothetical protein GCM10010507_06640 [Streptomyces cinnamoneus]